MEGISYNISYSEYYININIVKESCIFFNWNSINIYSNIKEFFGLKSLREDAIKYFKNYITNKVDKEYVPEVLDEFNSYINYNIYNNNYCFI